MNKLVVRKGKKPLSERAGTEKGDNMKKLAVFVVGAVLAVSALGQAPTWLGDSLFCLVTDASNPNIYRDWYRCSAPNTPEFGWAVGAFDGADLGTLTTLLFGGEVWTSGDVDPENNPAWFHYRLDNAVTWETAPLDWFPTLPTMTNTCYITEGTGDVDPPIELDLSGLAPGLHYLSVYFSKPSLDPSVIGGTLYDDNSGNYFTARFTVAAIPEPATMSLLGLGALAIGLRRKLRR